MADSQLPIGDIDLYPTFWQKPIEIQVHNPRTFEKLNLPQGRTNDQPDGREKKKYPGKNDTDAESGSERKDVERVVPQGYLSFDDTKFNRIGALDITPNYWDVERDVRLGVETENAIEETYAKLFAYFKNKIRGFRIEACTGVTLRVDSITNLDSGWWTGNISYIIRVADTSTTRKTIEINIPVSVVGERAVKRGNERLSEEVIRFKDSLGRLYDLSQDGLEELFGTSKTPTYFVHL